MSRLVPKLRFKEFSGEWEEKQLKDICSMQAGKFVSASEIYNDVLKGLNPCFGGNGLRGYTRSHTHIGNFPLIGRQGEHCGNVNFATGKFHATEHAVVATPLKQTNVFWLYYSLINLKLNQYATGQAQPGLSVKVLERVTVHIPKDPKEQQKIANTLSSLDNLIEAVEKKVEALKKHKKGLMQQLFPQEGERTPKLRFEEFSGEWEEKKLCKIIDDFIVPMRDKPKDLTGDIPWCRIEDFNGMYLSKSKTNQGITKETVENMNLKVYPKNTLLVSCSADLGRCAIVKNELVTNQTFIGLKPKSTEDVKFLYYLMSYSRDRLNALSTGTTIAYLSRQEFENFEVYIPSLKEQQKIANTLSSLDNLIEAQEKKVESLKKHKKGLMQQMFVGDEGKIHSKS